MSVVLIIAIITTNFLMVNKKMREGLENETTEDSQSLSKIEDKDPEIANAITAVKESGSEEEVKAKISEQKNASNTNTNANTTKIVDTNNTDLNTSTETGPEGFGESIGGKKNSTKSEHFGPRLDYAATIEQSYQNLDNILGSDSIKQLTNDTQKLMKQQQNLFNTMNQMVPVLEGAQNMLKGFDMDSLTKSLGSMSSLGNAPTIVTKNKK
jgi:predicted ATP-dependent protease